MNQNLRDGGGKSDGGKRPNGRRWPRVVVAVVALLVVAFCAWSLSQYAAGGDPLAWLSSQPAFQTTAETSDDSSGDQSADTATSVSKEDVGQAVESLTFDGQDVSLAADDFRVMLKADEGIWVEQESTDGSQDMVTLTTERLWALCQWVRDQGVKAPHVTWIAEDAEGYLRMIVTAAPEGLVQGGSASDILAGTEAYAIAYGDYTADVQALGIAQTKGDMPTYPDGNKADVALTQQQAERQSAQAEGASSGTPTSSTGPSSGSSDASDADQDTPADGSSPAGGSTGGSTTSDQVSATISVSIDGSPAGGSRSNASVDYHDGMTAYDALVATGASINARDTQFGMYVAAIDGLAEKEHGSMSGWVYAVNGVEPNTAASNYRLSSGDVVAWTYVNVDY